MVTWPAASCGLDGGAVFRPCKTPAREPSFPLSFGTASLSTRNRSHTPASKASRSCSWGRQDGDRNRGRGFHSEKEDSSICLRITTSQTDESTDSE